MTTPRAFFAWPTAASMLYLISAACLLGGAAYVLAPGSADEERFIERFAMLGTVFAYVGALTGLALLLCRWQPANDDAVALLALLSLFLPGMHAGLGTIASAAPLLTVFLGLGGLFAAGGCVWLIQKRVTGPWGWHLLLPLAAIQAWNALSPGILGLTYRELGVTPEQLLASWLPGWWLHIAAGCWLVVAARNTSLTDDDEPLIRQASLRWLLCLLALTASGLHQWLLGYAFNLGLGVLDLGAAMIVVALLLDLAARRVFHVNPAHVAVCEVFLGLWATVAVGTASFAAKPDQLLWLVCYPPLILGAGGMALAFIAWRDRQLGSALAAAVWLLGVTFTWGITADHSGGNWHALGAGVLVLAVLIVALPWKAPPGLALMAGTVLLLAGWLHPSLWPAVVTTAASLAHAWYHRRPLLAGVGGLPLASRGCMHLADVLRAAGGWLAVGAAFALLAAGTWLNWRRAHPAQHTTE